MAKKREKAFWSWLNSVIGNKWDAQRHEDKYSVGIPDVSYGARHVNGWIELKAYDEMPTKIDLRSNQIVWLTDRGSMGGHCFILVKVSRAIYLFDWREAEQISTRGITEENLGQLCVAAWVDTFDATDFIKRITE